MSEKPCQHAKLAMSHRCSFCGAERPTVMGPEVAICRDCAFDAFKALTPPEDDSIEDPEPFIP